MATGNERLRQLPSAEWDPLEQVLQAFERAWQQGQRPTIEDHLPGGSVHPALLAELVHLDLEYRLKAGEPARVEDYLRRFPALAEDRSALLELVLREYALRRRGARGLTPDEYLGRFPELGPELAPQLAALTVDQAGTDGPRRPDIPDGKSSGPPAAGASSRYRLLRLHARGGLGEVFVADDEELHRHVALKRIQAHCAGSADSRRRFLLEAEITGRLEHPGVVPVHGLVEDENGEPCYAMRFIQGTSLAEAIAGFHAADRQPGRDPGERRLALRQLLGRFVAVCNTIAYAHSRGIIHRDLKPGNIMLGKYGETLVVDWGLAKAVLRAEAARTSGEDSLQPSSGVGATGTQLGQALGTPVYMSPEQAAGRWDVVREASDIYSLGATLYALLTGQAPVQGSDAEEVMDKVRRGVVAAPRQVNPRVPAALDAMCRKAMALEPERRYTTALELAQEVERWLADEPVRTYREPRLARLARWGRRHPAITAGAAALLVTAVAALGLGLWAVERERTRTVAAKEQAERRFTLAQQAVDHYLNVVAEDKQLKERGFVALRKRLLVAAVSFYQQLAQAKASDPELQAARGRAYHRLAFVRDQLGEREAALAEYEQMQAVFAQLAADFPTVPQYRRELAISYNNAASQLRALGKQPEAEAAYGRARALQEKLAADFPAESQYRWDLAASYHNLGQLLHDLGKWSEAEAEYRRAIALQAQLVDDSPTVPGYRRELATSHNSLGKLLASLGRRPEAEAEYGRATALQEELAADFPAEAQYRRELATSHNNRGVLLKELGKWSGAEAEYDRAIALQEQLATDFPTVPDYRLELARSHRNLGLLLADLGKWPEAEAANHRALVLQEKLATDFPTVPQYRQELATSLGDLGVLLANLGKQPEAEAAYHRALVLQQQLAAELPSVPGYRQELAQSHTNLGNLLKALGKQAEAESAYRRALTLQEQLASDFPTVREYRQNLARSHNNLGALLQDLRKRPEAEAQHRRALALQEQLVADFPSVSQYAVELGGSYCNLGHVLRRWGEPAASLDWYAKARAALQPVLEKEPRLALARLFLHNVHTGRAMALTRLGRHSEAVGDWEQAIALNDEASRDYDFRLERSVSLIRAGRPAQATAAVEDLLQPGNPDPGTLYNAARVYTLAAAWAAKAASPGTSSLRAEQYARRAVALLRQAVQRGWKDLARLKKDPGLDGLRPRPDFQQLLRELEARGNSGAK
jgi:serine/threonine-protein kinase